MIARCAKVETAPASGVFVRIEVVAPTDELAKRLVAFAQNNNITNDAQFEAAIDGLSATALTTMLRSLVKGLCRIAETKL